MTEQEFVITTVIAVAAIVIVVGVVAILFVF
jgi:hypothetical protein